MSDIKDGGAAFPRPHSLEPYAVDPQHYEHFAQEGMSMRDYFAAKAMHAELLSAGSFAGPARALMEAAEAAGQTIAQRIAFLSYEMADAMLKQRALSEGRKEPIHG